MNQKNKGDLSTLLDDIGSLGYDSQVLLRLEYNANREVQPSHGFPSDKEIVEFRSVWPVKNPDACPIVFFVPNNMDPTASSFRIRSEIIFTNFNRHSLAKNSYIGNLISSITGRIRISNMIDSEIMDQTLSIIANTYMFKHTPDEFYDTATVDIEMLVDGNSFCKVKHKYCDPSEFDED